MMVSCSVCFVLNWFQIGLLCSLSPISQFLRTNKPNVFAAGDIVQVPLAMVANEEVNIGHWQVASIHGKLTGESTEDQYQSMELLYFSRETAEENVKIQLEFKEET